MLSQDPMILNATFPAELENYDGYISVALQVRMNRRSLRDTYMYEMRVEAGRENFTSEAEAHEFMKQKYFTEPAPKTQEQVEAEMDRFMDGFYNPARGGYTYN
jgi:plasmid stability protein